MGRITIGLLLFSLTLVVPVQGQSRIDSLETLLSNTKVDTTRARLLYILANNYIELRPGRTDTLADELMALARATRNGKALGQALNCKGMIEADYAVALNYFRRALVVCDSVGDKDCMGVAYQGIGNCRRLQGDKKEALSASFAALRLFQEIGATKGIAGQYANIGNLYDEQGDPAQALKNYRSAQAIFAEKKQRWPIAAIGANIGRMLNKLGQRKEALAQYRVSLDLFKQLEHPYGIATVLTNMSEVLVLEEGPAAALKCEQEALALKEAIDDRPGMSTSFGNLASFYLALGEADKAAEAADRAVALAVDIGSLDLQDAAYEIRIQVDSVRGDYRQAFADQRRSMMIRDTLFNAANTKELVATQMQYDFDMKEVVAAAEQEKKDQRQRMVRNSIAAGLGFALLFLGVVWRQRNRISAARRRSDELLLNILPAEVAEELKAKGAAEAKQIDQVTVLFTDFKGFTAMSETLSPRDLVRDLNECFSAFDHIMAKYGIEKIKTIGDAYMAAGGLPTPNTTHATDVINAALEIRDFIAEGKARKVAAGLPYFEIRIGIHTGPVVAGIVGVKKFAYDIWGDTVNTASRMESSGEVGQVNISEATFALVKDVEVSSQLSVVSSQPSSLTPGRSPGQADNRQRTTGKAFTFTPRGKVQVKGKGDMEMYFAQSAEPKSTA